MKEESFISKIAFFFNKILAIVTFAAYLLPFLAPKLFPFLSVLTLGLPFLLILNALFFIVWLLQLKRKLLLSAIVLLIGITFINRLYSYGNEPTNETTTDIKLMSFNVRLFNLYDWLPEKDVPEQITDVIQDYNPNLLCLQEYSPNDNVRLRNFPHSYVKLYGNKNKYGQAIFSKYKIVNTGEILFPNSSNNVIYADVLIQTDTVRVYSMHLQSVKISTDIHETIDENKSRFIIKRISGAFEQQQLQSELIKANYENCKYKKIICGDMNNSAFSYVYRNIRADMKDAFEYSGTGFGTTYNFKYYPARIDYIFVDNDINIKEFKVNDSVKLSDHFPIMARFEIGK